MTILLLKVVAAILACAVSFVLIRIGPTRLHRSYAQPIVLVVLAALAARIAFLALIHLGLGLRAPSDVPGWVDHGQWTAAGLVPNRDYATPYGVLFSYLLALSQAAMPGEFSVLALFAVMEHIGVAFYAWTARSLLGEAKALWALGLYLVNPLVVVSFWLSGQDEAAMVGLSGVVVWLASRHRPLATGAAAGFTFFATKLTSLFILGPIVLWSAVRSWVAFLVTAAAVAALFFAAGSRLVGVTFERTATDHDRLLDMMTSGNLWAMAGGGPGFGRVPVLVTLAALLLAGSYSFWRRLRADGAAPLIEAMAWGSAFVLIFNLFHPMSFSYYLAVAVFPMILVVLAGGERWVSGVVLWSAVTSLDTPLFVTLSDSLAAVIPPVARAYSTLTVASSVAMLALVLRKGLNRTGAGSVT